LDDTLQRRARIGAGRGLVWIAAIDSSLAFSEAQAGARPERMKTLLKI